MLYERWREIARQFRDELALQDLVSDRRWTFGELAAHAASRNSSEGDIVFPRGAGADFVLDLLVAWRERRVACPLELGATPPTFENLPKDCVHLKTTSASTGVARVVAFTAAQLSADAGNIVTTMKLRRDWPNLGAISLAHSYGFSNLVLPLLLHGIPLILAGSPLPENVRQAARHFPALTLPGVPALWRVWHEANAIEPQIKLAISAGALLPLGLERDVFEKCGLKIHNFYGSSECGGIAYDLSEVPRSDESCVGTAMHGVHLAVGAGGCLEVRGEAVGQTYWPETSPQLSNGCYHTSDLAEILQGLVYLRGRVSDQINVAGRKVAPEIVERALLAHPAVRDCLVFGVPVNDTERGEKIVACAALNRELSTDALREFLLLRLPAWQMPKDLWFVPALDQNERGKLSRAEWRRRYLEQNRDKTV